MEGLLHAEGPHPGREDELMLFGRFVGAWDMDVRYFDKAGGVMFHGPAQWSFGWILDGRAIQDVLVFESGGGLGAAGDERGMGTTLRFYDSREGVWRVIWLGAVSGILITLVGGPVGDDIVIEGVDVDGSRLRWTFTDIEDDLFRWQGFTSENGQSWRMEQEMLATRQG